jgi:hypothetical protein
VLAGFVTGFVTGFATFGLGRGGVAVGAGAFTV